MILRIISKQLFLTNKLEQFIEKMKDALRYKHTNLHKHKIAFCILKFY